MPTQVAEHPHDAFNAHCPSRRLLETIGDKWASLAVVALGLHGPLRYSELSKRIAGVSQKMLTQTLRKLERVRPAHPDGHAVRSGAYRLRADAAR